MKAALIWPTSLLEEYGATTDYHLVLTHLVLSDEKYREYYKARRAAGDWIIVDNGVYEDETASFERLLEAVKVLDAQEVVAPDVLWDYNKTVTLTWNFLPLVPPSVSVMAVPQADNLEDYWRCYQTFDQDPRISTVGITKAVQRFTNRLEVIKTIHQIAMSYEMKPHHLLGAVVDPQKELDYIYGWEGGPHVWIRGIDTCMPIALGLVGIPLERGRMYPPSVRNACFGGSGYYFSIPHTYPKAKLVLEENVKTWLEWCRSG